MSMSLLLRTPHTYLVVPPLRLAGHPQISLTIRGANPLRSVKAVHISLRYQHQHIGSDIMLLSCNKTLFDELNFVIGVGQRMDITVVSKLPSSGRLTLSQNILINAAHRHYSLCVCVCVNSLS